MDDASVESPVARITLIPRESLQGSSRYAVPIRFNAIDLSGEFAASRRVYVLGTVEHSVFARPRSIDAGAIRIGNTWTGEIALFARSNHRFSASVDSSSSSIHLSPVSNPMRQALRFAVTLRATKTGSHDDIIRFHISEIGDNFFIDVPVKFYVHEAVINDQ
jgi:hypothetical protein